VSEAKPRVIAIDGPAAAGKGTLGRRLAGHFGYAYLDSGLLYRAVGVRVLAARADVCGDEAMAQARLLGFEDLRRNDLRTDEAANAASAVAAVPQVRSALLAFQRRFAAFPPGAEPGVVIDGRDIGTVVCPQADIKLFVTARPEVRAARRLKELRERGVEVIHSRVLRDMQERDARDSGRCIAPLRPAPDAVVIDTSALDAEEVFTAALKIVEARIASAPT
jgi:cytidylate kinase